MPALEALVHETSTTTGTGNLTLSNVNGKQSFNAAFGSGAPTDVFDYYISNRDAAEWERGTGHLSAATTLVRDTVIDNSNGDTNPVTFSAGTKDVTNFAQPDKVAQTDLSQTLTNKDISASTNTYRSASETVTGAVELATDAETAAGDTTRIPTAEKLKNYVTGKQTVIIPAGAWLPEDGAAGPTLATYAGTNIDERELKFDGASTETAFFTLGMPNGADDVASYTFYVVYAPKGTSSGNVVWGIAVGPTGDGDSRDATLGTAVTDTSAAGATANVEQRTAAMTVSHGGSGVFLPRDTLVIRLQRIGGDGADTNTDDCGVRYVVMEYTTAAPTDD